MKNLQYFTLRVFLVSMLTCAGLILSLIWYGPEPFGDLNRLAFSLFVVGLACFLLWIVTIILEICDKIEKK